MKHTLLKTSLVSLAVLGSLVFGTANAGEALDQVNESYEITDPADQRKQLIEVQSNVLAGGGRVPPQ